MNIYYKRFETFCKYPFNQEIDEKWIEYSKANKNKFSKNVFAKSDVSLNMEERLNFIAKELNISKSKIELIKS